MNEENGYISNSPPWNMLHFLVAVSFLSTEGFGAIELPAMYHFFSLPDEHSCLQMFFFWEKKK